jgi:catechol 2,3-dioxygenase-like lactoylglutathione lyase family enzyme
MTDAGDLSISTINLSASDPHELARFYADLLGYEVAADQPDWVLLRDPNGVGIALSCQGESVYSRPAWPAAEGDQHMMLHLEIRVSDLDSGLAHARSVGARLADYQPQDDVRVCLDPAGHPFCLWVES